MVLLMETNADPLGEQATSTKMSPETLSMYLSQVRLPLGLWFEERMETSHQLSPSSFRLLAM